MTHQELQEFLGAYALDAVDANEASLIETHLVECPACRAEVAAHRETAAKLGIVGAEAPAQVWDRIAAELSLDTGSSSGSPLPASMVRFPSRRRLAVPIAALLGAAATVLIVLLGVSTLHLQHQVNALHSTADKSGLQQAAAAAVLNPNHKTVQLVSADGLVTAEVVTLPGGQAYLIGSNLPDVGADRTYQLWGLDDGKAVSLGLLGPHPELVAFRIDTAVSRLMVTAEPQGGRPMPDLPILIQGAV